MHLAEAQSYRRAQWESGELGDVPQGVSPCTAVFASGSNLVLLPVWAAKAVASGDTLTSFAICQVLPRRSPQTLCSCCL